MHGVTTGQSGMERVIIFLLTYISMVTVRGYGKPHMGPGFTSA